MDNNGRHIKIEKLPDWFPSRQGLSYDHEGFYRITDFDWRCYDFIIVFPFVSAFRLPKILP